MSADDATQAATGITGVVRNKGNKTSQDKGRGGEGRGGGDCRVARRWRDRKEEMKGGISKRRSQWRRRGCSGVVVQFGVSVLPQWRLCGVWQ